ncbi:MAG: hypothetical protein RLZ83_1947 [Pseudomonadota bacterium]
MNQDTRQTRSAGRCTCLDQVAAPDTARTARRRFMARLGAGLAATAAPAWVLAKEGAHGTDVLLLSCMDYRLVDDTERYMTGRGLRDRYDHVVLAGASLGAVTSKFPAWGQTFWDHLGVAIDLHHIRKVMVLDHRDCGAYKVILGPAHLASPLSERAAHAESLNQLRAQILARHPKLDVELLLMALDGSVEKV